MRSTLVSGLVAASLLIAPTAAIAAKASPDASALSLRNAVPAKARASAKTEDANALGGSVLIIGLVAVAAAIGLYLILDDDESESP